MSILEGPIKEDMARINLILLAVLITSCIGERQRPLECIRFRSEVSGLLSKLVEEVRNKEPKFTISAYHNSFTKLQRQAGEQWIVLRKPGVELSMRTHGGDYSDVCVYGDGRNRMENSTAFKSMITVKEYLNSKGIKFENPNAQ